MSITAQNIPVNLKRDVSISILLYATPVVLLFAYLWFTGQKPWLTVAPGEITFRMPFFLESIFKNLSTWGLSALMIVVAIVEFSLGLYQKRWTRNEQILDLICFVLPRFFIRPLTVYFTLKALPSIFPGGAGVFSWVPFGFAFLIIAVADDLTQYWYHRLHHQIPWLWRFHRTHHSAPYMGMSMARRQNVIYTMFFSQTYLTAALTYFGLGYAAIAVRGIKSLITTGAHSSIKWDKPFYDIKWLRPIGWVMERLISTPATHHAHHADTTDDGVGYYKGNFGNMFFIWDLIFGTGIITRKYPQSYGIKHYREEEWYVQFLWPIFKSKKEGSELAADGPEVADDPVAPALVPGKV